MCIVYYICAPKSEDFIAAFDDVVHKFETSLVFVVVVVFSSMINKIYFPCHDQNTRTIKRRFIASHCV